MQAVMPVLVDRNLAVCFHSVQLLLYLLPVQIVTGLVHGFRYFHRSARRSFVFQEVQNVLLCSCVRHHSFTLYNPCPTFSILLAFRSRSRAFCSCVPVNSVSFPRIWSRDSTPPLRTTRILSVVSVFRPSG